VTSDNTDQITPSLANANGATLGGTATVTVVNGVATFAGLSVNKAAAGHALTVASGGLTPATSSVDHGGTGHPPRRFDGRAMRHRRSPSIRSR
jgi:hypothetical protein